MVHLPLFLGSRFQQNDSVFLAAGYDADYFNYVLFFAYAVCVACSVGLQINCTTSPLVVYSLPDLFYGFARFVAAQRCRSSGSR